MSASGSPVHRPEKRKSIRVIFTRNVKVVIGDVSQGLYPIRNLSIAGLYIEGKFEIVPGAPCRLELHETGRNSSLILTFHATVVRVEDQGIAVEFDEMEEDSFMFLQTMVLYSSDDPIGVAENFLEHFSR